MLYTIATLTLFAANKLIPNTNLAIHGAKAICTLAIGIALYKHATRKEHPFHA